MIGDFTRIEERTNVKKTIIGKHCVVGKMAKLVGCVLLDHCVIGDGCDCRLRLRRYHVIHIIFTGQSWRIACSGKIPKLVLRRSSPVALPKLVTRWTQAVRHAVFVKTTPYSSKPPETLKNESLEVSHWAADAGSDNDGDDDADSDGSDDNM